MCIRPSCSSRTTFESLALSLAENSATAILLCEAHRHAFNHGRIPHRVIKRDTRTLTMQCELLWSQALVTILCIPLKAEDDAALTAPATMLLCVLLTDVLEIILLNLKHIFTKVELPQVAFGGRCTSIAFDPGVRGRHSVLALLYRL